MMSANLLCGCPKQVALTAVGVKHPLYIRLHTSDAGVFEDTFVEREYEYPTSFAPRTIVDVGTNCAMTSVFYANKYSDATVVAVEPEAPNYAALVTNTQAYPNIIGVHAALWNDDGQVEFSLAGRDGKSGESGDFAFAMEMVAAPINYQL